MFKKTSIQRLITRSLCMHLHLKSLTQGDEWPNEVRRTDDGSMMSFSLRPEPITDH